MSRLLRLTEVHVRKIHRAVDDPGGWPGLEPFTEEQYDEHLQDFLRERPEGPIGLFAYGSLIWKPVFTPAAVCRVEALGWQRAFTLRLKRFRGTPEVPGLMMQIDRGGTCEGILQIVPPEREWDILSDVWRREMSVRPPGNRPLWIDVEAAGKVHRAIAFTANPDSPNYVGGLGTDEVAACLTDACGHWGSGAEYLLQTVLALEAAGIHDPYLWDLQDRVAALIESRYPDAPPVPTIGDAVSHEETGGRAG